MAETNYIHANARFAFRSDTLENWESINPILRAGEFGIVTNGSETQKVKIGDGVTPWNELSWWMGPKGNTGIQGPQGIQGEKGEKGDDGATPIIDQIYDPNSENAQSGTAVAEAIGQNNAQIDVAINNGDAYAISTANAYTDERIGDIEAALDSILAMQNSLIGGDSE